MAELNETFDSSGYDDMRGDFDPLPPGEYLAMVKESDVKSTKKGDGKYIALKFEIIKGDFKGRFIWTNLNIINPNPVAVEIAQKELATLCRAIGKPVIKMTEELHGIPFTIKLKIKPAKDDYPAGNEPVNYLPATVEGKTDTSKKSPKSNQNFPDDPFTMGD